MKPIMKPSIIRKKRDELKQKQEEIKRKLQAVEDELCRLRLHCNHDDIQQSNYGTGVCPDCGFTTSNWFCESSPTKECDYYDKETGEYDKDCCIYCGQPE